MWYLRPASEANMNNDIVFEDAKLTVSFALGRNKTVYVTGNYNFKETSTEDRLKYWGIVSQFGQELGSELTGNYGATIMKIVHCEVDPGCIMFEMETNVAASTRRKAIEAVQSKFDDAVEESEQIESDTQDQVTAPTPENSFTMNGPETLQ